MNYRKLSNIRNIKNKNLEFKSKQSNLLIKGENLHY